MHKPSTRVVFLLSLGISLGMQTRLFSQVEEEKPREAAAADQAKKKKPVEMDELAKKTFEAWEKMEYNLGREGVKKIRFTIKAEASANPMAEAGQTEGKYAYDGSGKEPKSVLIWEDEGLGAQLSGRGWGAERFDRLLDPHATRVALAGTKLTGKKEGEKTILSIQGKNKQNFKAFRFSKDGVMERATMAIDNPMMGNAEMGIDLTFKKEGEKYLRTGWTFGMEAMGVKGVIKITWKKAGKYLVYDKVEEKVSMGEMQVASQVLTFSDYEFGDKAKATSKPTKKEGK